jgi:DNA-binding MarR family transcriptional regulator
MSINEEIKQVKFSSEQQRLVMNIIFTGNHLSASSNRLFKKYDLTNQQFNVLRILRGQKGTAITVKNIESRMLDRSSNVSRLIDKLLMKSFVERIPCCEDRRRVDINITQKGLDLLRSMDVDVKSMELACLNCVSEEQAGLTNQILDQLRNVKP